MNTALISSPEITGNIGSCTTQSTSVVESNTLFVNNIRTISTNSCTGQVLENHSWTLSYNCWFGLLFLVVIFIIITKFINAFSPMLESHLGKIKNTEDITNDINDLKMKVKFLSNRGNKI